MQVTQQTGVSGHCAKAWCKVLHAALMLIAMVTFLPQGLCRAQELPHLTLECPTGSQTLSKPFELRIIVSWEGDSESHIIVPPEPVFPESFSLRSSSFEAAVSDSHHRLTYCFTLVPQQTGNFTVHPVEVRFWPRGSTTEASLLTDQCVVTIDHSAGAPLKKIIPTVATFVLLIVIAGVYLAKRRTHPASKKN